VKEGPPIDRSEATALAGRRFRNSPPLLWALTQQHFRQADSGLGLEAVKLDVAGAPVVVPRENVRVEAGQQADVLDDGGVQPHTVPALALAVLHPMASLHPRWRMGIRAGATISCEARRE
jgi:hypothetical protein